jgi:uncharacterized protein (TIGR03663 family)
MSKNSTQPTSKSTNQQLTSEDTDTGGLERHRPANSASTTPAQSAKDWTNYFTPVQWALFAGVVVLGLMLRWTMLDMRPYHHDESLHGMYGRYFYDFPNTNYYKYDPMLHGPMLYNSMRFIYAMFGDSLWAARTPVCIMGSLFMLVPFLYRRYLYPTTTLLMTGYVALSPTMIYWSRFLREDYWVVSGMLFSLFGFTIAPKAWKSLLVMLGLTIQWCTKENVFVTVAVVAGFFIFEAFFQLFIVQSRDTYLHRVGRFVRSNFPLFCVSLVTCGVVYSWFYGAGFRYPQGIIDGLGGKAIEYWAAHHSMERIKGPFNFHIYVTAWYELPIFAAFLTHLVLFHRRALPQIQFFAGLVVMGIILSCVATDPKTIEQNALWKPFKLKNHLDIIGLFVLLCHAPLLTIQHLLRGERVLATAGYFFSATFFVYSYLGEKVPWLSVYPLIYSLPYLALFYQDYFKKYPFNYKTASVPLVCIWVGAASALLGILFIAEQWSDPTQRFSGENIAFVAFGALLIGAALIARMDAAGRDASQTFLGTMHLGRWATVITAIFLVRAAVQTNYLYAGKETEYLSQVHTTYELAEFAKDIIDRVIYERNGFRPKVYATGESTWPLTWYFRVIPQEYKFSLKDKEEMKEFAYIFLSWKEKHEPSEIPEGYIQRRVNLRGWWVPDFSQISLKKFLRYSINHYPWNTSGFSYATMLTAKDMERFRN